MNMEAAIARPARRTFDDRFGRSRTGPLVQWFWEIDRVLVLLVLMLISIGLIAVAAASPAGTERLEGGDFQLSELHYFYRQLLWIMLGLPIMFVVSTMPKEVVKRLALIGAVVCFCLLALTMIPALGEERNGARRWIGFGMAEFQPSEFLKPFFVVAVAWILSLRDTQDRTLPVVIMTGLLTAAIGVLLMRQPDLGQTVVFAAIWLVLLWVSGSSAKFIAAMCAAGVGGLVAAYLFYPVATDRIDGFLFAQGDTYQADNAIRTLTGGGILGTGPGGGEMKFRLPEPHTDYIFAVIGEEFGLISCLAIVIIFAAIMVRVFLRLLNEENMFYLLAAAGLAAQFVLQAMINIAVNIGIAPSKGMTLPFISYGGSSLLALSIGFGMLLAFTRRNEHLARRKTR